MTDPTPAIEAAAKLLPCPFCGLRLVHLAEIECISHPYNSECPARGVSFHESRADRMANWNTRAGLVPSVDIASRAKACFAELDALSMMPAVIERHMGMLVGDKDAEIAEAIKWKNAKDETATTFMKQVRKLQADLARHVAALKVAGDALRDLTRATDEDTRAMIREQITNALQRITEELKPKP